MMHSIMTVEEATGRIIGCQFPQGELPTLGITEDGVYRIMAVVREDIPEEKCTDYGYFIENYCYNKNNDSFVKVSTRVNDHAVWDIANSRWTWDASLVLTDIRQIRNRRLAGTDWTQLSDNALTDAQKSEAQTYRTALRNVTNSLDNPENEHSVSWPTPPSFLA